MKRENFKKAVNLVNMLDMINSLLKTKNIRINYYNAQDQLIGENYTRKYFMPDLEAQLLDFAKEYLRNEKQKAEQELAAL